MYERFEHVYRVQLQYVQCKGIGTISQREVFAALFQFSIIDYYIDIIVTWLYNAMIMIMMIHEYIIYFMLLEKCCFFYWHSIHSSKICKVTIIISNNQYTTLYIVFPLSLSSLSLSLSLSSIYKSCSFSQRILSCMCARANRCETMCTHTKEW